MMSQLCKLFSFGHAECRKELDRLMQAAKSDSKKIISLNAQITQLVNQVQELKAIHDFQSSQLEKKIADLEESKPKTKKGSQCQQA